MHEVLYAAVPAAAGAWYGTRSWLARRRLLRRPPGEPVADFTLTGADGRRHALSSLRSPIVVLLFMSNRCPGVKAYDGRLRAPPATRTRPSSASTPSTSGCTRARAWPACGGPWPTAGWTCCT
jgi:hypothetical protein